jgi:hypothetical protein
VAERLDVEAAGGTEQRIGCNHPIPLRADEPRAGGREILLRVEDRRASRPAKTRRSNFDLGSITPPGLSREPSIFMR